MIIGANVELYYKDEPDRIYNTYFSFGTWEDDAYADSFGVPDHAIHFYCEDGESELKSYMTDSKEDFVILNYELVEEAK